MKANELRIGNWVTSDKNWDGNEGPFQVNLLENTDYGDVVKPIPITEEWLIKFGFDKPINSSFYEIAIGGSTLQINPDNGVTWISRNGMSLNITQLIESVHKLQNLFHSWTGEELTIKE